MRILLDQGILDMRNLGQNALLQAAIERVRKLWPDASIGVTTVAPQLLQLFFPNVHPVSPDGSHDWFKNGTQNGGANHFIQRGVVRIMLETREELWYRWPGFRPGAAVAKAKSWFRSPESLKSTGNPSDLIEQKIQVSKPDYTDVVSGVDLLIATGSQYMCDHARHTAFQVLDRLEAAIQQGIPTAMVGQGMGPIEDQELRTRAKEVLPHVDLIFVRERLEAPALLKSLGVDSDKIVVTGDDAIELAYNARAAALGGSIGVSMRCMPSTKMDAVDLPEIGKILVEMARKRDVEMIGLPISLSIHERDDLCTRRLLDGYNKVRMSKSKFQTPLAYIKNVQRCRLVITGTFHGAVLALAQGIPVICLVRTSLYTNKFNGLVDLFHPGCVIVSLDDERFKEKLVSTVDSMWQSAEKLRLQLLDSATRQIEWGNTAYQRLFDLVESKKVI
jgi:polysaccharide pyruvyl transferase WcaK-like protein